MSAIFNNSRKNRILPFCLIRTLTYCLISILSTFLVPRIATADPHPCDGNKDDPRKVEMAEILFDVRLEHLKSSDEREKIVKYLYNGYKCSGGHGLYLRGAHAGWDARFMQDNKRPFYSLTHGVVVAKGKGANNAIAIYDWWTQKMVIYLHASAIFVYEGQPVDVTTRLGNQGDVSHQEIGPHVHVEVRELTDEQRRLPFKQQMDWLTQASWGSDDSERPTIDPIPYLYNFVLRHKIKENNNLCLIWARCKVQALRKN